MHRSAQRPEEVTSIAKMAIGSGVLGILAGIGWIIFVALLDVIANDYSQDGGLGFVVTQNILGVTGIAVGTISVVIGVGVLKLRPWAWTLGVAFYAVVILLSIAPVILGWLDIQVMLISTIIGGLCLYLLFTPNVRRAFGRA